MSFFGCSPSLFVTVIIVISLLFVKDLKSKLEEAKCILTTTTGQRRKWEEKLQVSYNRLDSVPGHAMLCAAAAFYLSRSPPDLHKELIANWLGYCAGTVCLGSASQDGGKLHAAPVMRLHFWS